MTTRDGGFVIGAYAETGAGGDKSSPGFGAGDFWIIKIDSNDNKVWEQCYGGSDVWLVRLDANGAQLRDEPFHTNILTGNATEISDLDATNSSRRFYRARIAGP